MPRPIGRAGRSGHNSASSDTDEVFQIDDYGSALIGTGTIDLYKTNRLAMRTWGVRSVDIDIIEWGSTEKSLQVLAPRRRNPQVRRMIAALSKTNTIAAHVLGGFF